MVARELGEEGVWSQEMQRRGNGKEVRSACGRLGWSVVVCMKNEERLRDDE
jgi:hypothetical protein